MDKYWQPSPACSLRFGSFSVNRDEKGAGGAACPSARRARLFGGRGHPLRRDVYGLRPVDAPSGSWTDVLGDKRVRRFNRRANRYYRCLSQMHVGKAPRYGCVAKFPTVGHYVRIGRPLIPISAKGTMPHLREADVSSECVGGHKGACRYEFGDEKGRGRTAVSATAVRRVPDRNTLRQPLVSPGQSFIPPL